MNDRSIWMIGQYEWMKPIWMNEAKMNEWWSNGDDNLMWMIDNLMWMNEANANEWSQCEWMII